MVYTFKHFVSVPKLENNEELASLKIPLNMEVTMYFNDESDQEESKDKTKGLVFNYDKVSVRTYRIGDLTKGIYKYIPIEFTYSLASVLHTWVHCTLMDVKFTNKTVFESYQSLKIHYEIRSKEDISQSDSHDEWDFDEFEVLSWEDTKIEKHLAENYFFKKDLWIKRKINSNEATSAIEYVCGLIIHQFNKLRDSYKQVYSYLK